MKCLHLPSLLALACIAVTTPFAGAFNPDFNAAFARQFGESQMSQVVLVRAGASDVDPANWSVYSRDAYRKGGLVRGVMTWDGRAWTAAPSGSGKLLKRVPARNLDLKRVKFGDKAARAAATQAAKLAGVEFSKVDYQLAANGETGASEWGLALQDAAGHEVGFCVISADTATVLSQDWTPMPAAGAKSRKTPVSEGEAAAKEVKQHVRKAWNWGENAGRETGNFFRELFRRDN